jgi:hypothetical protein
VDVSLSLLQRRSGAFFIVFTMLITCKLAHYRQHADDAQQVFSTASLPTLQHTLSTLKKLYASWEKASSKPLYHAFTPALAAGMMKLNTYYQRSANSDAHIMAMGIVLHDLSVYIPLTFVL